MSTLPNPVDITIDIETLSTEKNAVVLTIGACVFDRFNRNLPPIDSIHLKLDKESPIAMGMHISPNTQRWWSEQSEAARAGIEGGTLSLPEALEKLTDTLVAWRAMNPNKKINFWANDPDFDLTILGESYKACGQMAPWQYWEGRSVRTIKMLAEEMHSFDSRKRYKREGVHHNAEDDAIYQAFLVAECTALLQFSPQGNSGTPSNNKLKQAAAHLKAG